MEAKAGGPDTTVVVKRPRGRPKTKDKDEMRMQDMRKKKENRTKAKELIGELWEIERSLRESEIPARAPGRNLQQSVLEDVVARVRGIVRQTGAAGAGRRVRAAEPAAAAGAPFARTVREGLLNSRALGALYVCADDWEVVESSRAIEQVCPFGAVRGYVGFELPCFVHSEDQPALRALRMQVSAFVPGSAVAPVVVSLRMLRVCMDGGVLVMDYAQLPLEIVHVGRDEERGGRLHALLVCVLEPRALAPLRFTLADRVSFQASANVVSGGMAIESFQGTTGEAAPATEVAGGAANKGPVTVALDWLLKMASMTFHFADFLKFAKTSPLVRHFVKVQTLLGVAPDGVPWLDRAVAVEALGISSGYKNYFVVRMSGDMNWSSLFTSDPPKPFLAGVLKTPPAHGGAGKIGVVSLGFEREAFRGSGKRPIFMHSRQEWTHHPLAGVRHVMSQLLFPGHKGVLPDTIELGHVRTGPPKPALLTEFCRFDPQRAQAEPREYV